MNKIFERFLESRSYKLHNGQRILANKVIEYAEEEDSFLLLPSSGKTFTFQLLDEFFSCVSKSSTSPAS